MRWRLLLASLCPPLAVLTINRPGQLLPNLLLTVLGWLPGAVQATALVFNWCAARESCDAAFAGALPERLPG